MQGVEYRRVLYLLAFLILYSPPFFLQNTEGTVVHNQTPHQPPATQMTVDTPSWLETIGYLLTLQ